MSVALVALAAAADSPLVEDTGRAAGDLVRDVAAWCIALGVILGVCWRILRPHFQRLVREAAATSTAVAQTSTHLADLPDTMRRLDERQGRVEGVLATLSTLPERMTAIEGRQERESARVDVLQEALLAHITQRDTRGNTQ